MDGTALLKNQTELVQSPSRWNKSTCTSVITWNRFDCTAGLNSTAHAAEIHSYLRVRNCCILQSARAKFFNNIMYQWFIPTIYRCQLCLGWRANVPCLQMTANDPWQWRTQGAQTTEQSKLMSLQMHNHDSNVKVTYVSEQSWPQKDHGYGKMTAQRKQRTPKLLVMDRTKQMRI